MIVRFENKVVKDLYELEIKIAVTKYKYAKHIVDKYKMRIGQLIDAPDLNAIRK